MQCLINRNKINYVYIFNVYIFSPPHAQLGYDTFMDFYFRTLQQLMLKDDSQPFALAGLKFMAKFATSYGGEDAHPILVRNFGWLLGVSTLFIQFKCYW